MFSLLLNTWHLSMSCAMYPRKKKPCKYYIPHFRCPFIRYHYHPSPPVFITLKDISAVFHSYSFYPDIYLVYLDIHTWQRPVIKSCCILREYFPDGGRLLKRDQRDTEFRIFPNGFIHSVQQNVD